MEKAPLSGGPQTPTHPGQSSTSLSARSSESGLARAGTESRRSAQCHTCVGGQLCINIYSKLPGNLDEV